MLFSLLCTLVLLLLGSVTARSSGGTRLLVVLDDIAERQRYSQLWSDLEGAFTTAVVAAAEAVNTLPKERWLSQPLGREFQLTFETPKKDPALFKHGARVFDHLVILPSKLKALGPALTPNILLDFLKHGGNILLALSAETPTSSAISSLLSELDIHLPSDRSSLVVDHFNYDAQSAADKHDVLLVPLPKHVRNDVRSIYTSNGVIAVPRAIAQTLGNDNPLLSSFLEASNSAYSFNPNDESEVVEDPFAVGSQISLVSAMQARNSARFTVLGSAEILEDIWFNATIQSSVSAEQAGTANRDFAVQLTGWTFKELGVLKVGRLQHYLSQDRGIIGANDSSSEFLPELNPKIYRIKNDVTFSIELSEYASAQYIPFIPPSADALQLEFAMLSPFHRLTLSPTLTTANSTIYSTSFRLPDQHGIFNFRVTYQRPFYSYIDEKHTVTVRHFAHDEWPRSWRISGAWVWIAGVWVTITGWIAFVAVWLFNKPVKAGAALKRRD